MNILQRAILVAVVLLAPWEENRSEAQDLKLVTTYLDDRSEAPNSGLFIHGHLGFVGGLTKGYYTNDRLGIRIVDLSDPTNPQLISRIPIRRFGANVGSAAATDIDTLVF